MSESVALPNGGGSDCLCLRLLLLAQCSVHPLVGLPLTGCCTYLGSSTSVIAKGSFGSVLSFSLSF